GVGRGESLQVTERGQPVAILKPIFAPDDAVAALAARGVAVRRGAGNLAELPEPARLQLERPMSKVLEELREERDTSISTRRRWRWATSWMRSSPTTLE